MTEKNYCQNLYLNSGSLLIYRNLLKDPVINKLRETLKEVSKNDPNEETILTSHYDMYHNLLQSAESLNLSGNVLKAYIINLLLNDKNFFSLTCERYGHNIQKDLYNIALKDMKIIRSIIGANLDSIISSFTSPCSFLMNYSPTNKSEQVQEFKDYLFKVLNSDSDETLLDSLISYYYNIGCAELSNHVAFKWDNTKGLVGVKSFDKVNLDDIVGYEYQKETLTKNTLDFISGQPANNVLIIGSAGTGKSSSVKAVVNKFYSSGLRLVQISKEQLLCLSDVLKELKSRGKYFIIFIDDLSFEEFETDYKEMKSVLDGGVEGIPKNILIYATSNRRHLIKETWNDRMADEEIHTADSMNEKLSLSERFGIVITYDSPDKKHYLKIVQSLAKKQKIEINEETLNQEASKWELRTHGRSGRTAKQFINYISSSI
ncbi:ATP-binding protein [Clostridium sp. P21]|uniref:ATP-binding protein n=1 Tax=Clostridium muellerianum TaxID=2716538 RepID=A0A7Y0HNP0_9CLOT|nr:ATP-binding protein [Clostridium muellerianum]NMM63360.1 ATP-binding protein [Clostridium muellerianum]